MTGAHGDAAYDAFLDAIGAGEGYYQRCPNGHGSVPPTPRCPTCGATDLTSEPLPATGTLHEYSVVHVAAGEFAALTPYVIGIVEFGRVSLTGQIRDTDTDSIHQGLTLEPSVERITDADTRLLVMRP